MPIRRQERALRGSFLCRSQWSDVFALIVLWGPELELLPLNHLPVGFDVQAPVVAVDPPVDDPAQEREPAEDGREQHQDDGEDDQEGVIHGGIRASTGAF